MKQIFIAVTLFVLLSCSAVQIWAQDKEATISTPFYKHALGVGAGFCTGYGLSYRFTPNDKIGFQVNFAPYKTNTVDRYSSGLTFTYNLIQHTSSRLFIYQANHFYYNSYVNIISTYDPLTNQTKDVKEERVTDKYFNNGVGFGMEITFVKRVGLNIMTGYAFYRNFKDINITGETALYYKF